MFVFKAGPLAWNGSISFWMGTAVFVSVGGVHHPVALHRDQDPRSRRAGCRTEWPTRQTLARPARAPLPARRQGIIRVFVLGDLVIFSSVLHHLHGLPSAGSAELFLSSQQHLNLTAGVVNTLVLLTSSWFAAPPAWLAVRER